ncbi:MAG TPA: DUF2764 family protein [Spirochaetia bacterium]|nr:DUF2764 family protein [Spirochaetales bacterium]HRY79705.1 DUF2764 family protein [Spirochaetia bacterium]HRZ90685.1 DUF2764 family protein [Spirochaetia bacterium]
MPAYYYLRSTLPTLLPASAPPFSFRGFLDRCEGRMRDADFLVLAAAGDTEAEDAETVRRVRASRVLSSFRTWDKALRNELARLRAHKLGRAPEKFLRPGDPEWDGIRAAQAAAQCEDPLEGELIIEREKWAYLERLEAGHYFDLEALAAYALKLRILERKARFEAERGEASYRTAYHEILDTAEAPPAEGRGA